MDEMKNLESWGPAAGVPGSPHEPDGTVNCQQDEDRTRPRKRDTRQTKPGKKRGRNRKKQPANTTKLEFSGGTQHYTRLPEKAARSGLVTKTDRKDNNPNENLDEKMGVSQAKSARQRKPSATATRRKGVIKKGKLQRKH